ncbi:MULTISPECIES: restriction endonuclease subunit S [Providencia]|uniref:Restriction endonuclease subunit S n=1 Tax=Providencia huaxiensis TaxID=2027290 RepID=A0ABU2IVG9_9GAMM|nr:MULTISPECIES: restriction endonuclease subunit S [Providencia]MBZ3680065.1 restriction endonuclease subunit S [Providencia rettgeri]AXH60825.1 restriction endonuclease subunit S [Providencia huaxiensis]MDT0133063.1 restriction endonuclease subunit S [Providencia huaxiensis]MDT1979469.1 restriction endonuclease subunit S [Providencia huaxiensis]QLR02547.1 restriction endonuclease subunit S [Providencia rettgeri]
MGIKQVPLNEFITLQRGFDLPKGDRLEGTIPVVASTGIGGYHNIAKVEAPGVVIGRSGSIGGGQYIKEPFWPLNTTLWIKDFKGHDPRYVYYLMRSIDFSIFNVGSGVPTLNRNHLSSLLVNELGINNERAIAQLLGDLDDKIDINSQINSTLEQMAQALFKSWFVDFDPVIDNALDAGFFEQDLAFSEELLRRAELRKTVRESDDFKPLSEDIRQLFPNAFEECTESTLGLGGWVPSGWELGNLSDVTDILSGFAFKSNEFQNSGFGVIKIKNIGNDKSVDICDIQRIDISLAEKAKRFSLKDGDLLMAMTGATVGKFGFLVTENQEPYYLNQRVAKFEAIDESTAYLYCILNRKITESYIVNTAQGSAQPNISAKDILAMPLITAPQSIRELFNDKTNDSFQKIIQMRKQNIILEHLRDTLLPKLISGELSLDDIKIGIPEETLI